MDARSATGSKQLRIHGGETRSATLTVFPVRMEGSRNPKTGIPLQ
jgi:hypothetical protein